MKMTLRTIVLGGLIVFFAVVTVAVFIPSLIWNPPQTIIAHPYTEEQARGRELFYSNGCNYCHTQYVREQDTAMGPVSEGGNYVFDEPMTLGSERTGPDLSYVGHKRSETWEIEHLKNPRQFSPLSIMPRFEFLAEADLKAIAAYLFALGDRVAQERMILPPVAYAGITDPYVFAEAPPPAGDQPQGWPTWTETGLKEGKELYVRYCLSCHGCSGNGLGSYGGTLAVTPANFKQAPFYSMPDDQWFWHVSEGVPGTVMPTWKTSLTDDERWKVIRYIRQIFAQPAMHDPDEGDPTGAYADLTNPLALTVEVLDEGKAIFIRECMVCHGDAGRGHGPYGDGIQPGPPDFGSGDYGTLADPSYSDSDYFWRISEGVPWTAMPSWKVEYDEESRWKLVHYIRTMLTQTQERPPAPPEGQDFTFPDYYRASARYPEAVSAERGQVIFLQNCAHCHGLAGDGQGWDGQYLNPQPFDFRTLAGQPMTPELQGELFAKVTFGIQDTAMPSWGEWLPVEQRWDAIKYVEEAFMKGLPVSSSVYNGGTIAANYLRVSSDMYLSEGHSISVTHGADLYPIYCATCHGDAGQGDGPGTVGAASGGVAAFPMTMGEPYIYWRIWEGVPDSVMAPFKWVFTSDVTWDITMYLIHQQGGGQ
jgi:mono/diheme cytochrome c family protein